jgi:predicted nucleic-acid-binding protein
MKPAFLLDTNVLIRFFVGDDPAQLAKAKQLFSQAEKGECELIITQWIIAEAVYVLDGVYAVGRAKVAGHLRRLIRSSGIRADGEACILDALDRFEKRKVDFADALLAAESVARGLQPASFDRDLDKFADVRRLEPGQPITGCPRPPARPA